MKSIAIFASGTGTNAESIMAHFSKSKTVKVALVVSNNPKAGVLDKAVERKIPILILDKKEYFSDPAIIRFLLSEKIDLVVLAGFLWMIPKDLIRAFPGKIINIHPALLPKHGGKGMFGINVHRAVIDGGDKETGITIHHVNENFDEGEVIFYGKCKIESGDTPDTLAKKVQKLEHLHYPEVIEKLLK